MSMHGRFEEGDVWNHQPVSYNSGKLENGDADALIQALAELEHFAKQHLFCFALQQLCKVDTMYWIGR